MNILEQKYINYQDFFEAFRGLDLKTNGYGIGQHINIEEMYLHFKARIMDDIDEYQASLHD